MSGSLYDGFGSSTVVARSPRRVRLGATNRHRSAPLAGLFGANSGPCDSICPKIRYRVCPNVVAQRPSIILVHKDPARYPTGILNHDAARLTDEPKRLLFLETNPASIALSPSWFGDGYLPPNRSLNRRGWERRYCLGALTFPPSSAAACQGQRGS